MLYYKDRAWCKHRCDNLICDRNITDAVHVAASKWWGSEDAPFSIADFKTDDCGYIPPKELQCKLSSKTSGTGTQLPFPHSPENSRNTLATEKGQSLGLRLKN